MILKNTHTGPGGSKLMRSLVNVSLKFQMLISNVHQYFLLKKCDKLLHCKSFSHFFSTKNISVFGYKVVKHLMSWPLHKFVKLTMLWATGPWSFISSYNSDSLTLNQTYPLAVLEKNMTFMLLLIMMSNLNSQATPFTQFQKLTV